VKAKKPKTGAASGTGETAVPDKATSAAQIDDATVMRIAHLARIKVKPEETPNLKRELNGILSWVAELNAIDTGKVEPMVSLGAAQLTMRPDAVTDGNRPADVLKNAPKSEDGYFLVPKVIE
jgi:aspartyl-tRNA(Asn)/glutamyl-tRNA(Gln) amidotransferase subunit C